jgi:hypothetical protein
VSAAWKSYPWLFLLDEDLRAEACDFAKIPSFFAEPERWAALQFAAEFHDRGGPWPPVKKAGVRGVTMKPVAVRAAFRDLMYSYATDPGVNAELIIAFLEGKQGPRYLRGSSLSLEPEASQWEASLDGVAPMLVPLPSDPLPCDLPKARFQDLFEEIVLSQVRRWLHAAFLGRYSEITVRQPSEPPGSRDGPLGQGLFAIVDLSDKASRVVPGVTKRLVKVPEQSRGVGE